MKDKDELDDLKKRRKEPASRSSESSDSPQGSQTTSYSESKKLAEHTVGGGDTLSHLALKYYGSATKPYWMVIYQANKSLIGDDPNRLKRGITLDIPELPADLKK